MVGVLHFFGVFRSGVLVFVFLCGMDVVFLCVGAGFFVVLVLCIFFLFFIVLFCLFGGCCYF